MVEIHLSCSTHERWCQSVFFLQAVRQRLQDLCVGQGLFSDIVFQLDDGSFAAHRPMLMARCDMMKAMFSGDFRESNAKVVSSADCAVSVT